MLQQNRFVIDFVNLLPADATNNYYAYVSGNLVSIW